MNSSGWIPPNKLEQGGRSSNISPKTSDHSSPCSSKSTLLEKRSRTLPKQIKRRSKTVVMEDDSFDSETAQSEILLYLDNVFDKIMNKSFAKEDSKSVLAKTLNQCDHKVLKIRATALKVVVNLFNHKLCDTDDQVRAIAAKVSQSTVLEPGKALSQDKTAECHKDLEAVHVYICRIVQQLRDEHADVLFSSAASNFKPLCGFLIRSLDHERLAVSSVAAQHWSSMPPLPSSLMSVWMSAVLPQLNRLIPNLVHAMVITETLAQHLSADKPDKSEENKPEIRHASDVRNHSALALEHLCRVFPQECLRVLLPYLERWGESENWRQVEAATLCLGVVAEARVVPKARDFLTTWVQRLGEGLANEQPLIRAISCYTMRHFVNYRAKGTKDALARCASQMIYLLGDSCMEVKDHALRLLAHILAFCDKDLVQYMDKLTKSLVGAMDGMYDELRLNLFEAVAHLCGRFGGLIEQEDFDKLLVPIIDYWCRVFSAEEISHLLSVSQSLNTVITYSRAQFATYNQRVLQHCMLYIERCSTRLQEGATLTEECSLKLSTTFDLISSMFVGQGGSIGSRISGYSLDSCVTDIVSTQTCPLLVKKRGLVLLGQFVHACPNHVKLDSLIDVIDQQLSAIQDMDDSLLTEILWTTVQLVPHCTDDDDVSSRLVTIAPRLYDILAITTSEEGVVVNAAIAWSMIVLQNDALLQSLKSEQLSQLCLILQQKFTHPNEKVQLFHNLCSLVQRGLKGVRMDTCVQICGAAAALEVQDAALMSKLKVVLREVRAYLGNAGWNKVSQRLGAQLSYELRKRYKMY